MAFAIAAGRHPKFPTHQPITKSMYFLPRESVTMLPFVAATCSSAGSSLASGSRRRAGMSDPFRAQLWRRRHFWGPTRSSSLADAHAIIARDPGLVDNEFVVVRNRVSAQQRTVPPHDRSKAVFL